MSRAWPRGGAAIALRSRSAGCSHRCDHRPPRARMRRRRHSTPGPGRAAEAQAQDRPRLALEPMALEPMALEPVALESVTLELVTLEPLALEFVTLEPLALGSMAPERLVPEQVISAVLRAGPGSFRRSHRPQRFRSGTCARGRRYHAAVRVRASSSRQPVVSGFCPSFPLALGAIRQICATARPTSHATGRSRARRRR